MPSPGTSTRSSATAASSRCSRAGTTSSSWAARSTGSSRTRPSIPIIVPGCMDPLFRGQIPEGVDPSSLLQVEPLRAEYQDRDARVAVMDEQGLGAALLFPTLGCGVEEGLRNDVEATMASISAFNRWLEEDWGFDYEHRILAAPMLSLADPEAAVVEVESLLARGRRLVHVRPAPVPGAQRDRPLAGGQGTRPGLGQAGRGFGPRGLPPRRQWLQPVLGRGVGRELELRGVRQHGHPQQDPRFGPGHPRHHRVARHPQGLQAAPHAARGQHRERIGLDGAAGEAAAQATQPDAVGLRGGPAGHAARARVGHALPRGGPPGVGRAGRCGAHPLRFGLAPRRGCLEPARLHQGTRRLQRRRRTRKIMHDNCEALLGSPA